jgi:hypothetical protein
MKLFNSNIEDTAVSSVLSGSKSIVKFVKPGVAGQSAPVTATDRFGDREAEQTTCLTF